MAPFRYTCMPPNDPSTSLFILIVPVLLPLLAFSAPLQDIIGKHSYEVSMNWAHMSGHGSEDELALTSICDEMGEEVIAIRSLEDGGNRMVLTQIVRRPAENYEVRAKHFFKRVTNKSELSTKGREKKKNLSSNVVTVRRKK